VAYAAEFAEKTFSQLEGFGSYGFPESHARSPSSRNLRSSSVKWRKGNVSRTTVMSGWRYANTPSPSFGRPWRSAGSSLARKLWTHGMVAGWWPLASSSSGRDPAAPTPRDIFVPDLDIDQLKVKSRIFH